MEQPDKVLQTKTRFPYFFLISPSVALSISFSEMLHEEQLSGRVQIIIGEQPIVDGMHRD